MNIFSGIVVYVMIWWLVLFCTLPFGIKSIDRPKAGEIPGAPVHHGLKKKILVTSVIALAIWFVAYELIKSDWLSYRVIASHMMM